MGTLRTDKGARRAAELAFAREMARRHGLRMVASDEVAELRRLLADALDIVDLLSFGATPDVAHQATLYVSEVRERAALR